MRIVHIVPGAGNTFYCENCLRDVEMVRRLRRLGHDVVMVPMYLPLFEDDGKVMDSAPVFYGAVDLYLKHRLPLLRKAPPWVERLLDSPWMLRMAARRAGATRARGLETLTLSMLRGEHGGQAEELERLLAWLAAEGKADVVHLSNALLLGLAREIKRRLGVAVVCSLQDEDTWVDAMEPRAARVVWQTMAEKGADVDAFVAVSRHYAERMRGRLRVPAERMRTIHIGIDTEGHTPSSLPAGPPVVGYLSRISESEGFGLLVDALLLLKSDPRLTGVKLAATGGQTGDDRRFVKQQQAKLAARGFGGDLAIQDEFDRPHRQTFLSGLTVLSVPALKGGAFGVYLIEAMASGVPVVQPRLGAFSEIVEATRGGLLYEPNEAAALAKALKSLLIDPARTRELGQRGREAVARDFSIEKTAKDLVEVYRAAMG